MSTGAILGLTLGALFVIPLAFFYFSEGFKNTFWGGKEVAEQRKSIEAEKTALEKERAEYKEQVIAEVKEEYQSLCSKTDELKKKQKALEDKEKIINEEIQSHPELAKLIAYYDGKIDEFRSKRLRNNAINARATIEAIKREKSELIYERETLSAQLTIYETLFPWLLDFKELKLQSARSYVEAYNENSKEMLEFYHDLLSSDEYSAFIEKANEITNVLRAAQKDIPPVIKFDTSKLFNSIKSVGSFVSGYEGGFSIENLGKFEFSIKSEDKNYITSLKGCTCPSYDLSQEYPPKPGKPPCKHMIFLALQFGAFAPDKEAQKMLLNKLLAFSAPDKQKKKLKSTKNSIEIPSKK